jgi:hypothetical protein
MDVLLTVEEEPISKIVPSKGLKVRSIEPG